jgi:nucleoside-diphosphate-sugar epimerase
MSRTALVVGGTGPTGPHVIAGLQERGFEVAILHRGTHEIPELESLEHLHADPHFQESIEEVVGERTFDVVIGAYGRLRLVAAAFAGRCAEFVGVSGVPAYEGYHEPGARWPRGMPVGVAEDDVAERLPADSETSAARFSRSIHDGERAVLALHDAGAFRASLFRYPSIYGPRQLYPRDWSVIRRVLDGRRSIILPDGGLTLVSRCAAPNAAQFLMAAVDRPDAAAGEIFNVADVQQYSVRQWVQMIAHFAGGELDVVSMPFELAGPGRDLFPVPHDDHGLVSIHKAQSLLQYQELLPAAEALRLNAEWYLQNPPPRRTLDGMIDTFDYAAEDRAIEAFGRATASLLQEQGEARTADHPYAHPTSAGTVDHRGR